MMDLVNAVCYEVYVVALYIFEYAYEKAVLLLIFLRLFTIPNKKLPEDEPNEVIKLGCGPSRITAPQTIMVKPRYLNTTTAVSRMPFKGKLKPSVVYVFNHEEFEETSITRTGSSRDALSLRNTFKRLKCDVREIYSPKFLNVRAKIRKIAAKNFEDVAALLVVILSHGDRYELIRAWDNKRYYSLDDDILFPLFLNKSLINKPKILISQACKGDMEADKIRQGFRPSEYLKWYSTTEGFVSYRHRQKGSIFIQTLCKIVDQYGEYLDLESMIKIVNNRVMEATINSRLQVPSYTSTLSEAFYFGDSL